ncbi:hypothetical protein [Desulfovibrio sp. Huiquan2017]|uniref:hypothetical protein n=1 Tax=Desulfovibrio sp. Huiquan2017 TaxID=2816861 RepID=UPI001A91F87D|nr:hypothetical protein [Desulfovibrio sp. Huiquan2017]
MKQDIPSQDIPYRETWILLREIKAAISRQVFRDCLVVGASQENRYCLNPGHNDYRRNPVDRIRNLVDALVQKGAAHLAIEVVNLIAAPLDSRLVRNNKAIPDKKTIFEECIDDYCAKTALDDLIRSNASLEAVLQQAEKCKQEIEETVAIYRNTKANIGQW